MIEARDKLVEAVAKGLKIKKKVPTKSYGPLNIIGLEWEFTRAPKETLKMFKKLLRKDLTKRSNQTGVGATFGYMFDSKKAENCNMSDNAKQILKQLPQLPENLEYYFPKDSVLEFKVQRKDEHTTEVEVIKISQWIEREYYLI